MRTMFYDNLKQMAAKISRPRMARTFMSADDLMGILQDRFGSVRSTNGCNGTELLTTCPFCGKAEKLSVNPSKRVYHCWHCDQSGTLSQILGMDIRLSTPQVTKPEPAVPADVRPPSYYADQIQTLEALPADNPAIVYLRSRGFDPVELSRVFGLRYCRKGRIFQKVPFDASNTLIIPIVENGVQVGWQARLLYDPKKVDDTVLAAMGYTERKDDGSLKRPPKYLTSPGLKKQEHLFNVDSAKTFDTVVVTEGVFDCIRVGPQGVATLGKLVSDSQKRMLMSLWKTVILLLDPDAEETQRKLMGDLTVPGGPRVVPVKLVGYKDAGDCPRDELWRQINATVAS